MARPLLDIDPIEVEKLAKLGATNCEIADFFCVSEATIRGRFCDILLKGRADMKKRLRQLQWDAAERGNTVLLIWLGKQILGQSDKIEQKNETTINGDLSIPSITKAQALELLNKSRKGESTNEDEKGTKENKKSDA